VEMARMLRVMNAKSLLVVSTEFGGEDEGALSTIREVCESVDIPVQLDPGTHAADSADVIGQGLEAGAYRMVTTVSDGHDAEVVCSLLSRFGAQRLTVRFPAQICFGGDASMGRLVARLAESDCSRIMVTVDDDASWTDHPDFERRLRSISSIRKRRPFRVTVDGGVTNADDLLKLQALAVPGVDSVALGDPLYAARFPCQAFWCWNFRDDVNLDTVSTATLRSD